MFNIKNILTRRNDQNRSPESLLSSRSSDEGVENNASSAEGFLCPHCFLAFPTADALQNHYESTHSEGVNDASDGRNVFNCPACKMKLRSEIELQSHFSRHHSDKKEDVELQSMAIQVKALEEGKKLLQSELQLILKENTKVKEERDTLEQKAAQLSSDLADEKLKFDELNSKRVYLESVLKISEEKVSKLEVEVQQRPEADDVIALKDGIKSVQEKMNELALQKEVEKDNLQKQYNSLQETCSRLQVEKAELQSFINCCPKKEEMESLQAKVSEMSLTISNLKENLNAKEVEKEKLQMSLGKLDNYEKIKASLTEKQNSVEELSRQSSEKDSLINKLKHEIKKMKEDFEEMKVEKESLFSEIAKGEGASAAMLQLQEENARLQQQFITQEMLHLQAVDETGSQINGLRTSLKKKESEVLELTEKLNELKSELNQAQKRLQEVQAEKDALSKNLNLQIANLSAAQGTDKARLLSLENELSNLKKQYEEKCLLLENSEKEFNLERTSQGKVVENLQNAKKKQEKNISDLAEQLTLAQNNIVKKEQSLAHLENSKNELSNFLEEEKKGKSKIEEEYRQLQRTFEESNEKLKSLEGFVAENEATKNEFCDRISSLNEELLKSQLNESELGAAFENMNEVNSQLKEKCSSLDDEIKCLRLSEENLQNEKNSLLNELSKIQKNITELNELSFSQENKIKDLTELNHKEKANSEKMLKDFNLAKDVYLKDKMKMQKQIENLENDCAKQVSEIQKTVKSLENQLEEVEEKCATYSSSLDDTKAFLKQKELEWEKRKADHIAQVGVLTENVQTLREDLSSEQKRRENADQKLDEITINKLELEEKLKLAIEERKGLLERCIKSEAECEKLQKSVTDIRHKYDDSVAALQELGRENQSLQVENMKHITRKWAEDGEVTHCTACGKLFTVTVRKHHCRNCGSIFCNECSAKSATVAASKKPVRVCDVCYDEVTK